LCKVRVIATAVGNRPAWKYGTDDLERRAILLYGTDLILMRREAGRALHALASCRKNKAQ